MKKTITATIAALFLTTSLVGPARADADAIRLGVGILGLVINEATKGGKSNARGGKVEGRVNGKQSTRQSQTRQTKGKGRAATAAAATVAAVALPEFGPTPEVKPTAEEMTAWLADAPNREQAEIEADHAAAEQADPIDTTTTAATTEATPATETAEAEGIDLVDEDGRLWGNVPEATADKVWKAVDLGMKPSQAFAALSGLPHPDDKAKAEAVQVEAAAAETAEDQKRLEWCLHPARLAVAWTECRPYVAQQDEARAKAKAEAEAKALTAAADREREWAEREAEYARKAKEEADERAFADLMKTSPATAIVEVEKADELDTAAAPVAVVDEDQTAAIEPTAEASQPEAKPVEKAKPKLKLDL